MGDPGRTIHIRLSPRLQRKLEELHGAHYAGLPLSTIAKLLLADQLQKDDEVVLEIIQNQIRRPADESTTQEHARTPHLNTQRRRHHR
ncbi:MAG: hypothetical protein KIS92_03255 [Planctomycetota bacterium]|nr:hypothetical protein [Planctomycetota bacterium]